MVERGRDCTSIEQSGRLVRREVGGGGDRKGRIRTHHMTLGGGVHHYI